MDYDIVIVGAGPAGLSFARAVAGAGLRIAIIERQSQESLACPAYDGREIALTHSSMRTLADLGAWSRLPEEEISPLVEARVLNSSSPIALSFDTIGHPEKILGAIVSNHQIRRTLWQSVQGQDGLTIFTETSVTTASANSAGARVSLNTGEHLTARLLVAADSRFSAVRKMIGISAEMNPLGKAMLVCRVEHDCDHGGVATEWFGRGQTFAMLPLNGNRSSAVLTLPIADAERLSELSDEALGAELSARYRYRMGPLRIASSRHVYPLVTSFARRFAIAGAALIGDAAVGMHPVTAHGFNLGLASAADLANELRHSGGRLGNIETLQRFERRHRRRAAPIYRATNMIVSLYNDERAPALLARHAAIRLGRRIPLVRSAITSMLMGRGSSPGEVPSSPRELPFARSTGGATIRQ